MAAAPVSCWKLVGSGGLLSALCIWWRIHSKIGCKDSKCQMRCCDNCWFKMSSENDEEEEKEENICCEAVLKSEVEGMSE